MLRAITTGDQRRDLRQRLCFSYGLHAFHIPVCLSSWWGWPQQWAFSKNIYCRFVTTFITKWEILFLNSHSVLSEKVLGTSCCQRTRYIENPKFIHGPFSNLCYFCSISPIIHLNGLILRRGNSNQPSSIGTFLVRSLRPTSCDLPDHKSVYCQFPKAKHWLEFIKITTK